MLEGSYAKEPFDLRLTVLRLMRSLWKIILITIAGTVLFGGGYWLKNIVFGQKPMYAVTATYKIEYTNPPVQSGDYYINEMTWNTYLDSDEFFGMLRDAEIFRHVDVDPDIMVLGGKQGVEQAISAAVASDIHIPSITVSTSQKDRTELLNKAVILTMIGPFAESIPEVAAIKLLDEGTVELVRPDVRPLRAVILGAILSCFFATMLFLLREIGADSIWLPATLRTRYGLKALGTIESPELKENARYLFGQCGNIGVCTVDAKTDPAEAIRILQEALQSGEGKEKPFDKEWIAIPGQGRGAEAVQLLHGVDSVLLVVDAGLHAGKPLEYMLEYLAEQEVQVTAALLWNADEFLIRSYYFLPGGRV